MITTPLYTPEQVARLDRAVIEHGGIPGAVLMERAGRRLWWEVRQRWPAARRLVVVCGGGNNGGDGYVVGRYALEAGWDVRLLALVDTQRLRGDAARHARRFRAAGGIVEGFAAPALDGADVIVDALLGTGLDRPVEGDFAEAVAAINAAPAPVAAVDIPSGIHGRTGAEMGVAVRADVTATFVARKSGLYTGRGPACTGALCFDDLGGTSALAASNGPPEAPYAHGVTDWLVAEWLPPRAADAHKGHGGHVLVVGGDHGMAGAARLAGEAAARCGAGLVTVATRPEHVSAVVAARPELMVRGITTAAELEPLLQRASVVALGPGLGVGDWGHALFQACLAHGGRLVIDADGLNLLAGGAAGGAPVTAGSWILTPHPGEAARLLGDGAWDTAAVAADRFAAVRGIAERWLATVVLKGAGSLVDDGAARWLITTGNPAMASGGMGDLLTGAVAGIWAQSPDASTGPLAAVAGHLHACAGDRAAAAQGGVDRGLLAGDVADQLPGALQEGR